MPGTVVKQNGPFTYLIKVRDNLVWKRHIDHLRQRDDTPREFSKSIDKADSEQGFKENEFDDASETDDDYSPNVNSETTTTETAVNETRRYPERTRRPPDRLIHQDEI